MLLLHMLCLLLALSPAISSTVRLNVQPYVQGIEDKAFWMAEGKARVQQQASKVLNENIAKNVIVFVGDGMGVATLTASRIYKGQLGSENGEEGYHSFELFPDVGLVKTYNVDKQVPDSAGTATAMFCGIKTNSAIAGVDATVDRGTCHPKDFDKAKVTSLLQWAQDEGKLTGVVTTTRITHATPMSAYAHTTERDWECDGEIPADLRSCVKDIAVQLVDDSPGKELNVIFGGGLQQLGFGLGDPGSCARTDGRNLTAEWEQQRRDEKVSHRFVRSRAQMEQLTDEQKVLGLFGYGHMDYDLERDTTPDGTPSITDMTKKAIALLQGAKKGYALIVEGGRIDHAHHSNYAKLALDEAVKFDEAVAAVVAMTSRDDTLIVVTADHSHSITMNGYPERGNDILGFAHSSKDKTAYETLTYANGPGYETHRKEGAIGAAEYLWKDPALMSDRTDPRYRHFAPIHESSETHGGDDVTVYAIGPHSHLFNGVFEQSYIAHAISCATKMGPSAKYCKSAAVLATASLPLQVLIIIAAILKLTH